MKREVLALLSRTGALALARTLQRGRSLVLAYHGVLTSSDDSRAYLDDNFPNVEVFERQIEHIARRYRPIRLLDLVSYYERGEAPPPGSVAVTFDDGFANNYHIALPVLQKYGVPCTVFLATGMIGQQGTLLWTEQLSRALHFTTRRHLHVEIGRQPFALRLESRSDREASSRRILAVLKRTPPDERDAVIRRVVRACGERPLGADERERYDFLSWEQVRRMASLGVDFGSHTVSHPILSTLDDATVVREIFDSKKEIEAQLQRPCETFAYPNGSFADFGPRDKRVLREAAFRCAVADDGSLNGARTDLFAVQRVNIGSQFDGPLFEAIICGLSHAAATVRNFLNLNLSATASGDGTEGSTGRGERVASAGHFHPHSALQPPQSPR